MSDSPGKRQHKRDERGLERAVAQDRAECVEQPAIPSPAGLPARSAGDVVDEKTRRQRLQCLPAIERVDVVRGQESQIVGGKVGDELDRALKIHD